MIKRIGVIGIGKMGQPMTRHLLNRGFDVAVFDLDASRLAAVERLGAQPCASPKEVAIRSDLVIVIVGFDNEVMHVVSAPDGLLAGAGHGMIIAVASTVSIETMQKIDAAAQACERDIAVLDTPLCRGEPAAEAGKLLLLAGGKADVVEKCRPALESFANDCFLMGPLGAGQVSKMINNLLLWACVSANYEGLKLGAALGVDPEVLRQALLKSSGMNWALETWLQPRPMPWAEKDMAIVMQEADNARLSLPLCGVIREVVKAMKIEKGLIAPRAVNTR